jgi:hypothetical protein
MGPTETFTQDRTRVFLSLLNHLDASGRMVVKVADSRWHLAVTRFREGLKDSGLRRAFGQYLAGLWQTKDDAVTDFVQSVNYLGKQQDVLVSWASSAEALKEELLVIQSCLNTAGLLDDWQPLDFDLGADVSLLKKAVGGSIQYDNQTRKIELRGDADPGKLLAGILSMHLTGGMRFTLRKNHLKNDPRLSMMAGIIALEAGAGELDLTCQNLVKITNMLSASGASVVDMEYAQAYLQPAEQYLRNIFTLLKPEIEHYGILRGAVAERKNGLLVDSLMEHLFGSKKPSFDSVFSILSLLRNTFELQNLHDSKAQSIWALLSAAVYLSAQVASARQLLVKPDQDLQFVSRAKP